MFDDEVDGGDVLDAPVVAPATTAAAADPVWDKWTFNKEGILKIQQIIIDLFDNGKIVKGFKKLRTKDGFAKTNWKTLFALYDLGTDLGVGRIQGKRILKTFYAILEQHGLHKHISLRDDWRGVHEPFQNSYEGLFRIRRLEYSLPIELFGSKFLDNRKPLAKLFGIGLDIRAVLGEALLDIDYVNFSSSFHRENGMLEGYETGDDFFNICQYTELLEEHPVYGKPIPLCLGISSDKTQCNNSGSVCEQAVVISILNAKGGAYKMLFAGFVPLHLPYSDHTMDSLMRRQGR